MLMKEIEIVEQAIRETAEAIKTSASHGWTQSIDEVAEQMIAKYTKYTEHAQGNSVKFISYTGGYPNLCSGTLTLEIDGKTVTFGNPYNKSKPQYPDFWSSGGNCDWDGNTTSEPWIIDPDALPVEYQAYADEIEEVFNANVPWGCCGGCE